MPIKIKLNNNTEAILGSYEKDINRSEVDRTSNTLHLFDKLDKNGDKTLSVAEMKIADETFELATNLEASLENGFLDLFKSFQNNEIKNKISQVNSQNIHAVLAGFQVATDHSNATLSENNPRFAGRTSKYTPLTLPQAIINYGRIDDNCKKECLNNLLDAVAEASKENLKLDDDLKNQYIDDLRKHINDLKFNKKTNADLINALFYELLPNNGCIQGYEKILEEHGYDLSKLKKI